VRDLPKVTVVIPAYNMERYVERSVRSALGQTYPNLDVLVVDDGSTDATLLICRRLAGLHSNLQVVTGPNQGVAAARNRGTELAEGTYVAYLDADDLWHPTKVAKQVGCLLAHDANEGWAACYTLFRMVNGDDEALSNGPASGPRGAFFEQHLFDNHVGNGSSLLALREAVLEVGGFDPEHVALGMGGCEDYDLQLKLLRRYKVDVVREYLIGYRIHPRQMSMNLTSMALGRIAVIDKFTAAADVPADLRSKARLAAYSGASVTFMRAHDWHNLKRARRMIRALGASGGQRLAAFLEPGEAPRRLAKLGSSALRLVRKSARFDELDPCEGLAEST